MAGMAVSWTTVWSVIVALVILGILAAIMSKKATI